MNSGEKIKYFARKVGGLSKLADLMKMSVSNLSQYANNHSEPGLKILQRLHEAGCDMNWFFSDTDSSHSLVVSEPLVDYKSEIDKTELEQLKERLDKIEKLLKQ